MQNVLELLKSKGIETRQASGTHGGEYHSPCPGCAGRDRFHIWPQQNNGDGSFWCRGCGKGGDSITFLMEFNGLTYPEACRALDRPLSSAPSLQTPRPPATHRRRTRQPETRPAADPPPKLWAEKAAKMVTWAHNQLLDNKDQMAYLVGRGIREDTVKVHRLGWMPKDMWRPRESWGLDTIKKANGQKKRLWIPGGILIPLLDGDRVLRIRIRRPEGEPRFYALPGSDMRFMVLRPGNRAYVILEAELDALLVDQEAGDLTGTVALGSSNIKPDPEAARHLQAAAVILNALDYDDAGEKAQAWWSDRYPQNEHWPVPAGKDPGEAFQEGINLREWITAGLPKAWQIGIAGQSSLDNLEKEGAATETSPPESAAAQAAIPGPVRELARLLKAHPVKILSTAKGIQIRRSTKWADQNWVVAQQISQLVYFNSQVLEYIQAHPADMITGGNILYGNVSS